MNTSTKPQHALVGWLLALLVTVAACHHNEATSPPASMISVEPSTVEFLGTVGMSMPTSRTINLTAANPHSVTRLQVSVEYQDGGTSGWLDATLQAEATPTSLVLSPKELRLAAGVYNALVHVTSPDAGNSPQDVTVRLTMNPPQPAIGIDATAADFSSALCAGDPAAKNIQIVNAGSGTLADLQATVSYSSGQPSGWLITTFSTTTAPSTLTLRPSLGTLSPGMYNATVAIKSGAASVPTRTVVVTFVVTANSVISLSQTNVELDASQGGANPAALFVNVNNSCAAAGALTGLTAPIAYDGNASGWLSVTLSASATPATLTLEATVGSLPQGKYVAKVSVRSSSSASAGQSLFVTLKVGPPAAFTLTTSVSPNGAGTITRTPSANSYASGATVQLQANPGTGFQFVSWSGDLVSAANPASVQMTANKTVTATFALRAPELNPIVLGPGTLSLTWTYDWPCMPSNAGCMSGTQDDYEVEESNNISSGFVVIYHSSAGAHTSPFTLTLTRNGGPFYYRVRAYSVFGYSPYSAVRGIASTLAAPAAPSNLTATSQSASQINLAWSSNASNAQGVRVERCQGAGCTNFAEIEMLPANVTTYQNTGLIPATTYVYRIRAYNASGYSAYSNVAPATTQSGSSVTATRFQNTAVWPVVSLKVDGIERVTVAGTGIASGGSYDVPLAAGAHQYRAALGYWESASLFSIYTITGSFTQAAGTLNVITLVNPTIAQLMTSFSASRLWDGEYWDADLNMHVAGYRFFADGTCRLYIDGVQGTACTYSLLSYVQGTITFRVKYPTGQPDDGTLSELGGYYYMFNGPQSFPQIKYVNSGQP